LTAVAKRWVSSGLPPWRMSSPHILPFNIGQFVMPVGWEHSTKKRWPTTQKSTTTISTCPGCHH
jgi:hypothetical protein